MRTRAFRPRYLALTLLALSPELSAQAARNEGQLPEVQKPSGGGRPQAESQETTPPDTGPVDTTIPSSPERGTPDPASPEQDATARPDLTLDQRTALEAAGAAATPGELEASAGAHFDDLLGRPGGLTADAVAKKAATISPDAAAAEARHASASAQASRVIWQYTPRVTLTASYTHLSSQPTVDFAGGGSLVGTTAPAGPLGPGDPLFAIDSSNFSFAQLRNQYFLNVGLALPISDYVFNLSSALTGAKTAKRAARLNEMAARVNASANARLAYYDWVRSKLRVGEAEKSQERAQEQLDSVKQHFEAGRAARADVLRGDAFLATTELNVRRAKTQEAIAKQQLHVLMSGGKEAQPDWQIGEDFEGALSTAQIEKSVEELQREAMERRLEIRALDHTAYSFRRKAAVERSQGYPRLEGFGNVTYANPNPRVIPQQERWDATWDVGVRLTWTINDLGTSIHDAKSSEAEAREIEAQKRGVEYAVRTEVLAAHTSLEEARLATDSARRGLQAAEAAYQDRLLLFQNGRATTLDLLEAESALLTARLDLLDSYIGLRQARVRLNHAVGRDIDDVVTPPPRDEDPSARAPQ